VPVVELKHLAEQRLMALHRPIAKRESIYRSDAWSRKIEEHIEDANEVVVRVAVVTAFADFGGDGAATYRRQLC
jgi:hypothetical protein